MSALVYVVGQSNTHPLKDLVLERLADKGITAHGSVGVFIGLKLIVQLRFKGIKCHVVARATGDKKACNIMLNELLKAGLAEFEEPFDLIDQMKEGTTSVEIRVPEDLSPALYPMWADAVASGIQRHLKSLK